MSHRLVLNPLRVLALSLPMILAAGCSGELADTGADIGAASYHEENAYAEGVYGDYQAATKDQVRFELTTLQTGALEEISDRSINETLGVPATWLEMSQQGTEIVGVRLAPRDAAQDEWAAPVLLSGFEEMGLALADGTYRLLSVRATLEGEGGAASEHSALEVCWEAQGHCIVMDPVVLQLDAFSQTRRRLLAEGWASEMTPGEVVARPSSDGFTALASCTLNSHPTWTAAHLNYGGYWVDYKNVFGMTLVHKDVGAQRAGVSCYVASDGACKSSGYGFSNTSSCWANLGYTCDCDNTGNHIGLSADGSTVKSWSETRCTHSLFADASVSWTIEGVGSGFNIRWNTSGSVDSNGGQLYDGCSWH